MLNKVSGKKRYRKAQRRIAKLMGRSDQERLNRNPDYKSARDKMLFLRVDRAEDVIPQHSACRRVERWRRDCLLCAAHAREVLQPKRQEFRSVLNLEQDLLLGVYLRCTFAHYGIAACNSASTESSTSCQLASPA